jgi:hypothetical protein
VRRAAPALLALAVALLNTGQTRAQTWEYSPYDIQVWLAFLPSAELNDEVAEGIAETISRRAWLAAGATWSVRTQRCPDALSFEAAVHTDRVTTEAVQEVAPDFVKTGDKLFLLSIRDQVVGFEMTMRELDCRTRTWQPLVSRTVVQPAMIPYTAFDLLQEAFSPLVRIESTRGREAFARIRAGGLNTRPDSPSEIGDRDVLLPIIRHNDRLGEPDTKNWKNPIEKAAWTFLTISERKGNVLQCRIVTGMRSPLEGRSSSRTAKLALRVKPRGDATTLRLTTPDDSPSPLDGYEIHAKDPDPEATESELVGTSDWRGIIRIPRTDKLLQLFYVRNGGRLLARLPMVPGLEPEMSATMANDDQRLQAEGFVKGMQDRVMDIVARRKLYEARFERHLKKKELDKAKELLTLFRELDSRSELTRQLDEQEQRITSSDKRVQGKIDKLFSDTRQLLGKFLDVRTANAMAEKLLEAQESG